MASNSKKPWDTQKKKLNPDQSANDPAGDIPSWDPISDIQYLQSKSVIFPTLIINPKFPIINPSNIPIHNPIPFFRIPIFLN